MQIVTLANETILCEDCPLKGLTWGFFFVVFYLCVFLDLHTHEKPGSLKTFQTKSFPTRNYFQPFLVY